MSNPVRTSGRRVLAALLFVATACGDQSTTPSPDPLPAPRPAVGKVLLSSSALRLGPGDVHTVVVRVEAAGGQELTDRVVTFTSANPSVAQIDSNGVVHAVALGSTTVRATSEGVSATATVEVLPLGVAHELSRVDGARLPMLVSADTVEWDGLPEYHEVYLEAGHLQLTGGPTPRYELDIRYVEYDVRVVDGRRQMLVRTVTREYDRGRVQTNGQGSLQMESEIVYPLNHTADSGATGVTVRFRVPGTNDILSLFYRPML